MSNAQESNGARPAGVDSPEILIPEIRGALAGMYHRASSIPFELEALHHRLQTVASHPECAEEATRIGIHMNQALLKLVIGASELKKAAGPELGDDLDAG